MKTACALFVAALLTGCGGGLYIGWGGDEVPDVALAAGAASAAPGQSVRLAAAASDDDFVREVRFYRLEAGGGATFLGGDGAAPFELDAAIPADAPRGSTVRFFARAIDSAGQSSDSGTVAVRVS